MNEKVVEGNVFRIRKSEGVFDGNNNDDVRDNTVDGGYNRFVDYRDCLMLVGDLRYPYWERLCRVVVVEFEGVEMEGKSDIDKRIFAYEYINKLIK